MTRVAAALGAVALAAGAAGCPGARTGGDRADAAILVVKADVADAAIWLDGRYVGAVGDFPGGLRIAAGEHRIELRHDDHFSRYVELTLAPRERKVVEVDLAPVLP